MQEDGVFKGSAINIALSLQPLLHTLPPHSSLLSLQMTAQPEGVSVAKSKAPQRRPLGQEPVSAFLPGPPDSPTGGITLPIPVLGQDQPGRVRHQPSDSPTQSPPMRGLKSISMGSRDRIKSFVITSSP